GLVPSSRHRRRCAYRRTRGVAGFCPDRTGAEQLQRHHIEQRPARGPGPDPVRSGRSQGSPERRHHQPAEHQATAGIRRAGPGSGAGPEAMQIAGSDGTTVRIVASTYFVDSKDGVIADGRTLPGTLTLTAIGEPQTMQTALSIPGGALDTTRTHGGNVQVESPGTVQVTALHPTTDLKYAKPAP